MSRHNLDKLQKHIANLNRSHKKTQSQKQISRIVHELVESSDDASATIAKLKIRMLMLQERQKKNYDSSREYLINKTKTQISALQNLMVPGDPILNFNPQNKNITEAAFTRRATSLGWAVIKRGFPDYICWQDKQVIFVEVKPEGYELSVYQQIVMQLLMSLGLECFKWTPIKGLQKLKYNEEEFNSLKSKLQVLTTIGETV